ncbi:hypothetical protein SAMN02745220_03994 [Desulfopila aestuarii DSM 18488]|uniref:Uncharacterized protein n=1 Tax=Desulfopila aestuarii DSM 18488 TaxID=1121416 RepID=A0A1M7YFM3_9BACT|nr:hypothetical protein SAMN02745220_03994 [Desulfopila aestuarii DSM 18488]
MTVKPFLGQCGSCTHSKPHKVCQKTSICSLFIKSPWDRCEVSNEHSCPRYEEGFTIDEVGRCEDCFFCATEDDGTAVCTADHPAKPLGQEPMGCRHWRAAP